jgi:cytochrome c
VSILVVLASCSGPAEPVEEGARLYAELGCAKCHGEQLEGKRTAPPLLGLAEHWDAEGLTRFVLDPVSFEPVPARIREIREATPLRMPPLANADDAQVATLIDYLLRQEKAARS